MDAAGWFSVTGASDAAAAGSNASSISSSSSASSYSRELSGFGVVVEVVVVVVVVDVLVVELAVVLCKAPSKSLLEVSPKHRPLLFQGFRRWDQSITRKTLPHVGRRPPEAEHGNYKTRHSTITTSVENDLCSSVAKGFLRQSTPESNEMLSTTALRT